jgi:hypothetical protein
MSVLMTSHTALLAAILAVCGFFGLGQWISQQMSQQMSRWKSPGVASHQSIHEELLCTFLALILCGVLLSLRTWLPWAWITWLVWSIIILGSTVAITNVTIQIKASWGERSPDQKWHDWAMLLAMLMILYLEWVWVGLPLYRYDQWTYHLVVAKWVDLLGTLKGPIAIDHVFFTGCYEFLGLLPRALWRDDSFQQGFQNCFTSVFIASVAGRLCFAEMHSKNQNQRWLISIALMLMVLFSSGDHEGLSSAKPDFVLMMAVFLLLWICVSNKGKPETAPSWFLFGMLMGACLALKITWIHCAVALLPIAIWSAWGTQKLKSVWSLCCGGFVGLLAAVPFLLKNYLVFGNPLHPAQTSLWTSHIWSDGLAQYWRVILESPETTSQFLKNIPLVIVKSPLRLFGALLVIAGLIVIAIMTRSSMFSHQRQTRDLLQWPKLTLFYGVYVLFWGFFYGSGIGHRFVVGIPAIGLVTVLAVVAATRIQKRCVALTLLIPIFWGGEIEVTIARVIAAWGQDTPSYQSALTRSPAAFNDDLRVIAAHKIKMMGPLAAYDQGQMISDSIWNFYGPSVFFDATAPVTRTLMEQAGIDPDHDCAKPFLVARDIRYLWLKDKNSLPNWPRSLTNLMARAESIPTRHGNIWYLGDPERWVCQSLPQSTSQSYPN